MLIRFSSSVLILSALSLLAHAAEPVAPATGTPATGTPAHPKMGEQADGSVLVSSNQTLTPLGRLQRIEGVRPKDMALAPDGVTLAVLTQNKVLFFAPDGTSKAAVPVKAGPLGLAWAPDGRTLFATGDDGQIYRIALVGGVWKRQGTLSVMDATKKAGVGKASGSNSSGDVTEMPALIPLPTRKGNPQAAGLAVSPDGKRLFVALAVSNAVSVLDLATGQTLAVIRTGIAPYRLRLAPDGKTLVVANRGGRAPKAGEAAAPSEGTLVRVDPRTDAALRGSLSFINTQNFTAVEIEAGRQPADMTFSADGKSLYVANSDEDTVSFFDFPSRRVRRVVSLRPPLDPGFGQIPTSLALSSDGSTLYAACGGGNSVAVINVTGARVTGYLPTGWFPIAIAERDGRLFVASSKGFGARIARPDGGFKATKTLGLMQFITAAQQRDIALQTHRVALNNHWGQLELPPRPNRKAVPIPERVGEPSLFKHVVFIIKENHTYDTDFGDMPAGNGDAKLCLFGENVTPNEHALAREWVLLDNTYTSGTNSADGHQWTDAAIANGYMEQNFANFRSYPAGGGDPLAHSPRGFLWNSAIKAHKTLRVYGEAASKTLVVDKATGKTPTWMQLWEDYQNGTHQYLISADTNNAALKPYLHPTYIGFPNIVSDQYRADTYLADLKQFEAAGVMPQLSILLLPNNHTAGTKPDMPTPRAMVANNDLALGRIVESLSKSRFWQDTLILGIEDDSQLSLDHVDGHRTVAFCISPYTRRGAVVSEPYNHTSLLRTIGLVLGLPAMNRFDRTATPMTACFVATPDFRPYTHQPNRIALDEMNKPVAALRGEARRLAQASARLDWSEADRADATVVARALWQQQRPQQPFPWRNFNPNKDDKDNDD